MRPASGVDDAPLSLIGRTPLVHLRRVVPGGAARVLAKCEQQNPGGSVKDRVARAVLERAERDGLIEPERTMLVDTVAGNLGLALALTTAIMRYKLTLVVPRGTSRERVALLRAYGAQVETADDPDGRARELAAGGRHHLRVREAATAEVQRQLAEEIALQLGRVPDAVVAGVGTGTTLAGLATVFKAQSAGRCRAVAVLRDARDARVVQGLATELPARADLAVDDVRTIAHADALQAKLALARSEGLLCGVSGGAAVCAATALARELGTDATVVTVLPDTGERYFFEEAP